MSNRTLRMNKGKAAGAYVQRVGAGQVPQADVQRLTVSSLGTIYGCCGLFDLCGDDDLISLTMQGSDPFLDWIGWEPTDVCVIEKNFISWVRPSEFESGRVGWLADPCAPANSVEFGTCAFRIEDFARLRRAAPTQDITKNHLRLCERQPRYRLDGTQVNDDREFRALLAMEAITQDLKTMIITGNAATPGQFSGLENLIKTGYTDFTGKRCALMDSIVINWNSNTLAGGAGITWTDGRGARNVSATANFIDVLLSALRVVMQRIKMSPTLAAQTLQVGDIVLLTTSQMAECILDYYTCWKVCPGTQYNETSLNTLEAREFRDSLMGGMFNGGKIFLDGFEIPLIRYDWGLQKGPTRSDVYLLTGGVGNIDTVMGQHNNMNLVRDTPEMLDYFGASDGGRFLHYTNFDETCVQQNVEFQPRLLAWAPWASVRFQLVRCENPGGVLSPDPLETSFFPETSFIPAVCP